MLRSLAPDDPPIEIVTTDADNTVGWSANVCVQVRTGKMTLDALQHLESTTRLMRLRTPGLVGAFAVLEEGAEIMSNEIREKQREVVSGLLADPRSYAVAYIAGSGTKATLLRSITRLLAPKGPRIHNASNISEGASWLAGVLGTHTPEEITRIVARVRAVARESVQKAKGGGASG